MNIFAEHVIEYTLASLLYGYPYLNMKNIEIILTLCKCYNGGFGDFILLLMCVLSAETMAVKRKMLANFLVHGKN